MGFQGFLRQSTAVDVLIGPFVDSTNGDDEEVGLTINATDVRLSKNGQGAAQKSDVTACAPDAAGFYNCELDATDTNTVGQLTLYVHVAGALAVRLDYHVVEEAVYDAMYAASAAGPLQSTVAGRTLDVAATGEAGLDFGNVTGTLSGGQLAVGVFATGAITADALAADAGAEIADAVWDEAIEDHDTQGNAGWAAALAVYGGEHGPGIWIDSGAANTNTVVGTDGTHVNPVSTFAAARTLADAIGVMTYYLEGNSDITLAATHVDWLFVGIGEVSANVINLGSQDVSRSEFRNLTVEGTQGGTGRIKATTCALQDPGAGDTTLHIFAERCGIVDNIQVDTSNDNVFDSCFSLVAGTGAPVIQATGAAGTICIRHYSGGIEFQSLSASHNVTWEGVGQVIFNANCNVNATVALRGVGTITDNTAGMAALSQDAFINLSKIKAEADTAISDAALATAAALATVDGNVDAILADTGELQADWADGGRLDLLLDSTLADTGELQTDWADGGRLDLILDGAATQAEVATEISDALTVDTLGDSYAADGSQPTFAQAILMIRQFLIEKGVAGSVVTVYKPDGTTPAFTLTLNDGTNPTTIHRTG